MPAVILVGDIVNVTLAGIRPKVLPLYEVLTIPGGVITYWEFGGSKGDIVAVHNPIVTKPPPP